MIFAADAEVRALAVRVLDTYGIEGDAVLGMSLELNAYGVQCLVVRLLITPAALAALATDDEDRGAT